MSQTLILIPTQFERQQTARLATSPFTHCAIALCGFGAIVSGVRTARLIDQYRPSQVLLLGIAGTYSDRLQLGAAYEFDEVTSYGIGVGSGCDFQTAGDMGWQQWSGSADAGFDVIGDVISLARSPRRPSEQSLQLLTACAAAANPGEVGWRQQRYPRAAAEDMEGFAVAVACRFADVPLRIIRGISNASGHRDQQNWQIATAMHSAAQLAKQVLEG